MRLNIRINVDNDAFENGNLSVELARIINRYSKFVKFQCANKVRVDESFEKALKDINGNIVGRVEVSKLCPSDHAVPSPSDIS